jgi:hypothetical protein
MKQRTQRQRVAYALRVAGPHGICQTDFLGPDTIDGLRPILRLPSRVDELRKAGYVIENAGWRNRCTIYRLISEPGIAPPPVEEREERSSRVEDLLFGPEVGAASPLSPYDAEAER